LGLRGDGRGHRHGRALIYLQKARISPDAAFSVLDWTAYVIFIVVIGGIGTIEGPIVGVLVFMSADQPCAFRHVVPHSARVFAILVMLFAPRGFGDTVGPLRPVVFRSAAGS
jgi:branched-chain amino acid transport system permease protein